MMIGYRPSTSDKPESCSRKIRRS